MTQALADGLLIPGLILALMGWVVPRLFSLVFPEGVRPLLLLAFASAVTMTVVSMGMFVALYVWRGAPLGMLFADGVVPGLVHFARLGGISALLWGPILILSVAGLPRTWVKETW